MCCTLILYTPLYPNLSVPCSKEREKLVSLFEATEQWLYDEGEDQPKKVYVERLAELKKLTDPIVEREREMQERPKAFDELGSAIIHFTKILDKYHKDGVSALTDMWQ